MTTEEMEDWIRAESTNWYHLQKTEGDRGTGWFLNRHSSGRFGEIIRLPYGISRFEALTMSIEIIKKRAIENEAPLTDQELFRIVELQKEKKTWISRVGRGKTRDGSYLEYEFKGDFPNHNELCRLEEKLQFQNERMNKQ